MQGDLAKSISRNLFGPAVSQADIEISRNTTVICFLHKSKGDIQTSTWLLTALNDMMTALKSHREQYAVEDEAAASWSRWEQASKKYDEGRGGKKRQRVGRTHRSTLRERHLCRCSDLPLGASLTKQPCLQENMLHFILQVTLSLQRNNANSQIL